MKIVSLKKAFITASILVAVGHADIALAHSGGGTIDPGSNNASATDLAAVTCSGGTDHLFGQIKDMSKQGGPILSFHIYKGQHMTTSTDNDSFDDLYSPGVQLNGGDGVYYISATKTSAGARIFDAQWHCEASNGDHTNTDITVYQVE
jgi:hypothetical protein